MLPPSSTVVLLSWCSGYKHAVVAQETQLLATLAPEELEYVWVRCRTDDCVPFQTMREAEYALLGKVVPSVGQRVGANNGPMHLSFVVVTSHTLN